MIDATKSWGTLPPRAKSSLTEQHSRRRTSYAVLLPLRILTPATQSYPHKITPKMIRVALDVLYKVFFVTLLLGIVTMDVEHWPLWRKEWTPAYFGQIERWYVKKYNDPILAGYATPNGWMSAMYFCEQLHLPFLLYFLFAKSALASSHDVHTDEIRRGKEGTGRISGRHSNRGCRTLLPF